MAAAVSAPPANNVGKWSTPLTTLFVLVLPPLGALGALATLVMGRVQGVHIALFLGGFVLTGLGITIGYHRLATHRSFETNPLVKAVLYILGSAAVEGPVVEWVANHMKHHINADREGDPHSPRDGLLHSHWGWLTQFAEIEAEKYASWTLRDPVARAVSATFIIWVALGYVVPFLIAGWEGFLWGGLFRQCAVQNVTFAVNSVCHRWGAQPFNTNDLSRNNWIVGILGLGEGWHNNHHAFPVSAYHGLRWWEFDLSGIVIRVLEAVGLVKNVRRPALGQIQRKLYVPAAVNLYERVAS